MENKALEQEYFQIIDKKVHISSTSNYQLREAARKCSEITLEHMKGFGDFISKNFNIDDEIGWFSDFGLDENNQPREQKYYKTEQLINLYFESLNKKS